MPRPSRSILIVDDDPEVVRAFGDWLTAKGYDVRRAFDGQAALDEAAGVCAIVADVRMPTLDGLGFLRQLRNRGERTPVVVVTGDYLLDEAVIDEFRRLDAQIVFKPLWMDELAALVSELVDRSSRV